MFTIVKKFQHFLKRNQLENKPFQTKCFRWCITKEEQQHQAQQAQAQQAQAQQAQAQQAQAPQQQIPSAQLNQFSQGLTLMNERLTQVEEMFHHLKEDIFRLQAFSMETNMAFLKFQSSIVESAVPAALVPSALVPAALVPPTPTTNINAFVEDTPPVVTEAPTVEPATTDNILLNISETA